MRTFLFIAALCIISIRAAAQLAIGTTNIDSSAILELKSFKKGALLPRMDAVAIAAIQHPAKGLLVYDTVRAAFYHYTGSAWQKSGADDLGNHTASQNINLSGKYLSGNGGNNGVFVSTGGNVGIGLSTPAYKLDVAGSGHASGSLVVDSNICVGVGSSYFKLDVNGSMHCNSDAYIDGKLAIGYTTTPSGTSLLNVNGSAHISTGITTFGNITTYNGDISAYGDIHTNNDVIVDGWVQEYFSAVGGYLKLSRNSATGAPIWTSSDRRLKQDIETIPSALAALRQLHPVRFNWSPNGLNFLTRNIKEAWTSASGTPEDNQNLWNRLKAEEMKKLSVQQYGFIAQELEQVYPDWVKEEDGYKQIKTDQLLPVVIKAVQELEARVAQLEAQNARLQQDNKALRAGAGQ